MVWRGRGGRSLVRVVGRAVLHAALAAGAACAQPGPSDDGGGPHEEAFAISARLRPGAMVADPSDPPPDDGVPGALPEGVTVLDLGLLAVRDGQTADILVETRSLGAMQVVVFGHPGASVVLAHAADPEGNVVVTDDAPADLTPQQLAYARGFPGPAFSTNRALPAEQSGAFLLPNTPAVTPLDGTWTLRVGQSAVDLDASPPARTPVDRPVRVLIVARGPEVGRGRVALNVWRAASMAGSADDTILAALDVVREAWTLAGISLDVSGVIADAAVPAVVALEERSCAGGALDAVIAADRGGPAGIDIAVVDRFSCILRDGIDVGSAIGGLAAGLPGPSWLRGSRRGGVAVALDPASGDPRVLGTVMVHELSHLLGLYHTRESGGGSAAIHDEIEDSPDGDDADENLMYHVVGRSTALSLGQAQVLRLSPWVVAEE